ncbi:MAG: copper-binding protein [Sandaracinaceae bacterium]|nr:copper-binding protein [Sandaracinaceae bacterium]
MKRRVIPLVLALCLGSPRALLAQCHEPEEPVHATRGRVVAFERNGLVRIAHEAIPGVMAAMTMVFAPCPAVDLTGVAVGDTISFRFTRGPGGRFLLLALEPAGSSR